jgi:Ca2+:H+ antiporter
MAVLAYGLAVHPSGIGLVALIIVLVLAVLEAVSHAELVSHRVGEPLGALVLAVCVTVIEASLIIMLMLTHRTEVSTVARDTVFSAFMIVVNAVVGLCIIVNVRRAAVVRFHTAGASALLATVLCLGSLSLVLPSFTHGIEGGVATRSELIFAAATSLVLYLVFIFVQTIRHKELFTPTTLPEAPDDGVDVLTHRPSRRVAMRSLGLLALCLVVVVGLAEVLSDPLEHEIHVLGLPEALVGLAIAVLVLLPESVTAVRAAKRDEMQTSLNLSLGSAVASIGLTIPVVAIASILLHQPLALGLPSQDLVLFVMTAVLASITLTSGEATVLQGAIHLVVFLAFAFLVVGG